MSLLSPRRIAGTHIWHLDSAGRARCVRCRRYFKQGLGSCPGRLVTESPDGGRTA